MMNQVVEMPRTGIAPSQGRMTVAEVVQQAMVVQEVMQAVMKPNLHYGKIPGTDKPTLLKAGAEKLCMVFKIDDDYAIEDLTTSDVVRYRVKCIGTHQTSQVRLGSGVGECGGGEEKYKWRKAICKEEFEATPINLRRSKFAKAKGGGFYKQDQVRTEPADLANTVLKMAAKRAKIAMVLNVLAVSDMFGQDFEDLDEALRDHLAEEAIEGAQETGPAVWPAESFATQFPRWEKAIQGSLKSVDDILALARSKGELTADQEKKIRAVTATAKASEAPAEDPFVAALDAAEQASEVAQ
jgi:hypothetical protein